jgi:hypothetical protein
MGYTTEFAGRFSLSPALSPEQVAYLKAFSDTRRMRRDPEKTALRSDPVRYAVGLPVGGEGEFFVGESGFMGQERSDDVIDYNAPPRMQPGLWCQWVPTDDRAGLEWNGVEKFYYYTEWLNYLIANFLALWGVSISGHVLYQGEEVGDCGRIEIIGGRAFKQGAAL